MASVQKRVRNGQTRWIARWRDSQGRERSKTFDRRADAQRWGVDAEAKSRSHAHLAADRDEITVGEWLDAWLDDVIAPRCAAGRLAATTAAGYEQKVRTHLRPRIGHLKLAHLTPGHVDEVMTDVIASGLAARTARGVRAVLSKALSDALRRDLVDRNVAAAAAPPPVEQLEPSSFTLDEFDAIVDELEGGTYGRLLRFMVLTGMRTSEVLGLRWLDVDLDGGSYQVRQTVHRISAAAARVVPQTGVVVGSGKTDASRRETRLSAAAVALLREQRTAQAQERLAATAWADPEVVFASEVGTKLDPSNVRGVLDRAMDRAGVPKVGRSGRGRGLHEFRRTFATMLLSDGVPVHVVQRLGRWASPEVLLASYAGVVDEEQTAAADRLADRLGGG